MNHITSKISFNKNHLIILEKCKNILLNFDNSVLLRKLYRHSQENITLNKLFYIILNNRYIELKNNYYIFLLRSNEFFVILQNNQFDITVSSNKIFTFRFYADTKIDVNLNHQNQRKSCLHLEIIEDLIYLKYIDEENLKSTLLLQSLTEDMIVKYINIIRTVFYQTDYLINIKKYLFLEEKKNSFKEIIEKINKICSYVIDEISIGEI